MAAFQIKVTNSGREALVNAQNTGTLPVLVSQVGVSATAMTVDATATAIPDELKRLVTFAGSSVAGDTIHITVRDDSADSYSLRTFALYLDNGALFALFSQPEIILEKSAQATLLLSADIIFSDIDAAGIIFGDTTFINPPATTEVPGVVELATPAETEAGTDAVRAVTPTALKAATDLRFGAGAPSTFVKGLLTAPGAPELRTALGLKSAALKSEGAGNLLDADKVDGQEGAYYLDWNNFANKPATFIPSAHGHSAADITSGTLVVARGGTGISAYTAGNYLYASAAGTLSQRTPAQVLTNIGAAAAAHTHAAGDIVSGTFADLRVAQSNVTQHQGALSIAWTQVTGKPATFTPSAHTHASHNPGNYLTGTSYDGGSTQTWAVDATTDSTPSKVVARDPSGDINARLFRSEYDTTNATIGFIMTQIDTVSNNFIRPSTPAQVKAALAIGIADVASLQATLNQKANLSGASFTGAVTAPTLTATSSDARLKSDITDLRDCLSVVKKLRPRSWRWKTDGQLDFGFVAQEHRVVLPSAVHQAEPQEGEDEGLLYVRYGKAEALLVGAVQELAARIERLEQLVAGSAR